MVINEFLVFKHGNDGLWSQDSNCDTDKQGLDIVFVGIVVIVSMHEKPSQRSFHAQVIATDFLILFGQLTSENWLYLNLEFNLKKIEHVLLAQDTHNKELLDIKTISLH